VIKQSETESPVADEVMDLRGLQCPLPLLKTKQRLNQLGPGVCLHVMATDAGSVRDFSAYLGLSQHHLLAHKEINGEYHFWMLSA